MSAVVSDSSPLNYLALLSDFDLLRQIYHTVVIPPAVYREVVESGADYPVAKAVEAALGDWASVAEAPGPAQVATLRRGHRIVDLIVFCFGFFGWAQLWGSPKVTSGSGSNSLYCKYSPLKDFCKDPGGLFGLSAFGGHVAHN